MNLHEARAAIEAILDAIPDDLIPKPDKIGDKSRIRPVVWFGGTGYHVGSGRRNDKTVPTDWHRSNAIGDLFNREAVQRYERDWWLAIAAATEAGAA